ncbi:ankyrin repeat domain-containing protein [Candidatus Dependentiae bacterium]|nr:ankyrin repeat domain-containing protein [Candidatus Dependentiae bacterium]
MKIQLIIFLIFSHLSLNAMGPHYEVLDTLRAIVSDIAPAQGAEKNYDAAFKELQKLGDEKIISGISSSRLYPSLDGIQVNLKTLNLMQDIGQIPNIAKVILELSKEKLPNEKINFLLEFFIKANAPIGRDSFGRGPVHYAILNSNEQLLDVLLNISPEVLSYLTPKLTKKQLIDSADNRLEAPLMYAARGIKKPDGSLDVAGTLRIIEKLIAAGARVNEKNDDGKTAYELASKVIINQADVPEWNEVLQLLSVPLEKGTSFQEFVKFEKAIQDGNWIVARALYEQFPDLLEKAVFLAPQNQKELVKSFIASTPARVIEIADPESANYQAAVRLFKNILTEQKNQLGLAFIDQQNAEGKTLLMMAIENGKADIIDILLDAGARTDLLDKNGRTPLILATLIADKSNDKKLRALALEILEKIAARSKQLLTKVDAYDKAPFDYALENDDAQIVEILVKNGLNATATMLSEAAHKKKKNIALYLSMLLGKNAPAQKDLGLKDSLDQLALSLQALAQKL